jgi:hypothetical protein
LTGCKKTRSAESAANEFMDSYYIEKDHAKALTLAVERAASRVSEEKKLLDGAGNPGTSGQPRVFYKHLKTEERGEATWLTYALTIDLGGSKLQKEVSLSLLQRGEDFKVSFFLERDLPGDS